MACARRTPTWSIPIFSPSSRAEPTRCESKERSKMKIVVIGGTGLIGSKTVAILRQGGHEVVAASPNTRVNTITRHGLKNGNAGTPAVIHPANSPPSLDQAGREFFPSPGLDPFLSGSHFLDL